MCWDPAASGEMHGGRMFKAGLRYWNFHTPFPVCQPVLKLGCKWAVLDIHEIHGFLGVWFLPPGRHQYATSPPPRKYVPNPNKQG